MAVTSPTGSEAAQKGDWTPLAGRRVLTWPDADEPGLAYARDVRSILADLGTEEIDIVDAMALALEMPGRGRRDQAPPGWDAADAVEEGWDLADLREAVLARAAHASDEPRFVSFGAFTMDGSGLTAEIRKVRGENASIADEWVSGPFEVIGRTRDPAGHGWAKWLRWRDPDGRRHESPSPMPPCTATSARSAPNSPAAAWRSRAATVRTWPSTSTALRWASA
jgi:putative DNA primase/helicase